MDSVSTTDNYLSLLLSLPNISPMTVLSCFFLSLGRILPILAIAPFFGSKNAPAMVRMLFGVSLIAIFLPHILLTVKKTIPFDFSFMLYFFKELFIGFILAFFVSAPFYIAQTSGSLVDHMRGASSLQVTDPTTQSQTGPMGLFYNYTLIAVFFMIGGPFLFFNAISTSFQLIPVDQFISAKFFSLDIPLWKIVITFFSHVMNLAIQLAAPSIVGILMAEMFLGIANRLAPQVQIVFLGIPLKSWIGIAMLALAWALVIKQLGKESIKWIETLNKMIELSALAGS